MRLTAVTYGTTGDTLPLVGNRKINGITSIFSSKATGSVTTSVLSKNASRW